MTPDERDRILRLEIDNASNKQTLVAIEAKVDDLLKAAHMGAGAWWLLLRIGAVLTVILGGVAWLLEKLHIVK